MNHKLKILHLEDSPTDAELVEREIRKAGLYFDLLLAGNKKDFLKGLTEFQSDIVLSDHSLPDIDSHEALKMTKLYMPSIPFILITATVSEEHAVEIMKEGAYDYILKDRLQRLPKAIENAIEKWATENERQRYMEQTIASEARYRQIVETAQEGIWLFDREFRGTFVNGKLCDILEYSQQEIIGREVTDFMDEESKAIAAAAQKRRKERVGENIDIGFLTKRGKHIWASLSISSMIDQYGNFTGGLAMVTDITSRKLTEEKLKQERSLLRTLIDNLPDYIFVKDVHSRHLINNKAGVELLGLQTEEETLGRAIEDIIPEYVSQEALSDDQQILTTGKALINKEECIITQEGNKRWLLTTKIPLKEQQGVTTGLIGISRDITERKQIEEKLAANEKRFRALVENTDDIIGIVNALGKIEYVSPSAARILGYDKEELNRLSKDLLVHSDDMKQFDQFVAELLARPEVLIQVRFRVRHKTGQWRWLEGSANNLIHVTGVKGIVTNLRDVTEGKILEKDLEQKKYFLEKAQQTAKVGYWISDPSIENGYLLWSKETCRIFGLEENEFDQRVETFYGFIHPEERAHVIELARKAIAGESVYNIDHRIQQKNGNIRWVNDQAEIERDKNGRAVRMIGIVQDITERKIIEEVLRQFNERYELLSKATNDAIWDWDIKLGMLTWNHALQTVFGYPEQDVEFTYNWWNDRIHPDDQEEVKTSIHKSFADKQNNWSFTYRFRTADSSYKYVHDRAYIIYDTALVPIRMIGAMQDISDRMEALEEIEKLSFVASKTDNAVMITDPWQRIEWVNESFVRMTGYTLEEAKGRKPDFLRGPETDVAIVQSMDSRIRQGESFSGELINYSKTGRKYWLKLDIAPAYSDDGKLKNFISIQSDITQQKEFESKITAIARELSTLIENANVPIFGIDRNGYINEWNNVSAELSGISKSELWGRRWIDELVGHDHRQAAEQMIAHVLHGNSVSNFELPVFTKSNKRLILLLSASPRRDTEKIINGAILVAQDVTELIEYRRNLEKMVQDRTRELNEALQKEKELVNMKSKFVSIASHEFRTPLSTITLTTGFLKKFKQKISVSEIDDKLANIEKQVSHMTHLLDDVLMIGKVEAGKIPVRLASINVLEFFERLCSEVEQSTGRSHEIRLVHSLQVPTVLSDEKLLRNILINALTNAIKFSPNAKNIDVSLYNDADKLSLKIRDYGIGIPDEDMKQLYEPFHRGSNVNAIQGTGLGLSIIKKGVDLLKGFIDVKSGVGTGTELNIILPVIE